VSDMKSALEKAMERVEKMGKATPQELRRMEYMPKGSALAAKYIREGHDLQDELGQYEPELRGYLIEGVEAALLRTIVLPQNEASKQTNVRAMQGMLLLKKDKARVESVSGKIEQLVVYYEQALQQAYAQQRSSFEARLEGARRGLEQQSGARANINVEAQFQFQEEWRRSLAQLNSQYDKVLAEHKQELKTIT